MELRPFKELIAMSKEKLDEAMALPRAKLVELNAKTEMAKLEGEIAKKNQEVQEIFTNKKDINFPTVMDTLEDIALLELRHARYETVLDQLFPKEKADKKAKK